VNAIVLIGGAGADTILIGSFTNFDSDSIAHDLAPGSIFAEWQSANSYATRNSHIKNGGGLNGSNRPVFGVIVHDDSSAKRACSDPPTPRVD
jgi:hypothetical protein